MINLGKKNAKRPTFGNDAACVLSKRNRGPRNWSWMVCLFIMRWITTPTRGGRCYQNIEKMAKSFCRLFARWKCGGISMNVLVRVRLFCGCQKHEFFPFFFFCWRRRRERRSINLWFRKMAVCVCVALVCASCHTLSSSKKIAVMTTN